MDGGGRGRVSIRCYRASSKGATVTELIIVGAGLVVIGCIYALIRPPAVITVSESTRARLLDEVTADIARSPAPAFKPLVDVAPE